MQPAVPKRARCSPILMAAGLAAAGLAGLPSANGQMGITEWQPADYWTACDAMDCPATDREVDSSYCLNARYSEKCRPPLRPYTTCKPGEKVSAPGTGYADRRCEACPDGTVTAEENAAECQVPKTCQPGQLVESQPTKTVDRVCAPCPASTFSVKENQISCQPQTKCQPGTVVTSNSSGWNYSSGVAQHFDTVCAPCAAGSFTTENNAGQCKQHQPCVPPLVALSEGTPTADRACGMEPATGKAPAGLSKAEIATAAVLTAVNAAKAAVEVACADPESGVCAAATTALEVAESALAAVKEGADSASTTAAPLVAVAVAAAATLF